MEGANTQHGNLYNNIHPTSYMLCHICINISICFMMFYAGVLWIPKIQPKKVIQFESVIMPPTWLAPREAVTKVTKPSLQVSSWGSSKRCWGWRPMVGRSVLCLYVGCRLHVKIKIKRYIMIVRGQGSFQKASCEVSMAMTVIMTIPRRAFQIS